MTLLCTAVETAISEVHKLLSTGGVPNSLPSVVVLAVADGLFGLCGSERADELFISSCPPPLSPSLISLMVSVDVKHPVYGLTKAAPFRAQLLGKR